MTNSRRKISGWLERSPPGVMNFYAVAAAFSAYFCIYAFRKPFTAATFDGLTFVGTIELKTAIVVGWLLGYTLAKYVGVKVVSEASRSRRAWMLVGLVIASELALLLFAVATPVWKPVTMLLNGLPLGMVWGLVVRYLEGRRTSDILLAGLACSFIVASGFFKDMGRAVMLGGSIPVFGLELPNPLPKLDEFWMPAATGLLFLPALLLSVWLLDQLPGPTASDITARTERDPMNKQRRRQFLSLYLPGISFLVAAYMLLTALRDYRDYYLVDVLKQLGYLGAEQKSMISRMELGVAVSVLIAMALLYLIKHNRTALMVALGVIAAGFVTIGIGTLLHASGRISGYAWIALVGLGGYMAYVPYNSVLFDRLMASTGFVGTAVFGIYVADSAGYTCSISIQVLKDILAPQTSRAQFLENLCGFVSMVGTLGTVAAAIYFWRRGHVRG